MLCRGRRTNEGGPEWKGDSQDHRGTPTADCESIYTTEEPTNRSKGDILKECYNYEYMHEAGGHYEIQWHGL